jgi:hypothetical protein
MAKKIRVWDGSVWQDVATGMASGVSTAGGSTVTASATSVIPLILKGASGQTSDLLQIQNSSDTVLFEVDSGGNLGVGTTALTTASGYASITLNGTTGSLWSAKVAGTETFRIQPTSTVTTINGIANIPVIFNTNNTERVRITASGDVGIGGIVPSYKLDVSSTARFGGSSTNGGTALIANGLSFFNSNVNWNYGMLNLVRNASNTSTPRFIDMALDGDALTSTTIGATNSIWGIYDSSPTTGSLSSTLNAVLGYGAYAGHRWYNNGSEKMRIDSVGSVIIGSTVGGSQKRGLSVTSGNSSGSAGGIYIISATSSGGDGATIEAIGQRSDGNGSRTFSGTVALGHLRTDAASASGQVLGSVVFGGNPSGTAASNVIYSASIYGIADGTWSSTSAMPTALSFYTGSTGTALPTANADIGVERMRINSAGNVGIGPIVSGAFNRSLSINSESGQYAGIQLVNNSTGSATSDGSALYISNSALVLNNREASTLSLATSNVDRVVIASNGDTTFGRDLTLSSGRMFINSSSSVSGANWGDAMFHLTGINDAASHPGLAWHAPGASAMSIFHIRGTQALELRGNGNIVDTTAGRMTIRNIAVSTSAPSGGVDGDMWAVYV